jgi:hypothetical protein
MTVIVPPLPLARAPHRRCVDAGGALLRRSVASSDRYAVVRQTPAIRAIAPTPVVPASRAATRISAGLRVVDPSDKLDRRRELDKLLELRWWCLPGDVVVVW